jgi:hypothetical protein
LLICFRVELNMASTGFGRAGRNRRDFGVHTVTAARSGRRRSGQGRHTSAARSGFRRHQHGGFELDCGQLSRFNSLAPFFLASPGLLGACSHPGVIRTLHWTVALSGSKTAADAYPNNVKTIYRSNRHTDKMR